MKLAKITNLKISKFLKHCLHLILYCIDGSHVFQNSICIDHYNQLL